jgi:hypothetical protein
MLNTLIMTPKWLRWIPALVLMYLLMAHAVAGPMEWGKPTKGCRLSLTAGQSSYRFDEPIDLQLILENQSEHAVTVADPGVFSELFFEVLLPSGEPAPMTLEGRRQATMPQGEFQFTEVTPKASAAIRVESLGRFFDMTLAGTYTITVSRGVWSDGHGRPSKVRSNTIKIEVHERGKIQTPTT